MSVVPAIKRHEIGAALLGRIERVAGKACVTRDTRAVLRQLARKTGTRQLVVVPAGVPDSRYLVGGMAVFLHVFFV